MSIMSFVADNVSHSVDQDCDVLAFYNDDTYLFLQRHQEHGHKEDEGVYIECKDQLHCAYDVIDRVEFTKTKIKIIVNSPLYQLKGVEGFEIDYPELSDDFVSYKILLEAMLGDHLAEVIVS